MAMAHHYESSVTLAASPETASVHRSAAAGHRPLARQAVRQRLCPLVHEADGQRRCRGLPRRCAGRGRRSGASADYGRHDAKGEL